MSWECVKWWAELLESVAVTVAAGVAIVAALRWRKDFVDRRRLEFSEHLSVKLHVVKSRFADLKIDLQWFAQQQFLTTEDATELDTDSVMQFTKDNWDKTSQAVDELLALEPQAVVLLGAGIASRFEHLSLNREFLRVGIIRALGRVKSAERRILKGVQEPEQVAEIRDALNERVIDLLGPERDGSVRGRLFRFEVQLKQLESWAAKVRG